MTTDLQIRPVPRRGAPRIVVVDDDSARRYVVAEMLRAEGYEVLTGAGHEGVLAMFAASLSQPAAWVSFVAAHKPDVVVVDVGMRLGEGLVTVGALTKHPLTMHLPVLAIGTASCEREIRAASSMGAATVLSWPVGLEGLGPYVEDLIERR